MRLKQLATVAVAAGILMTATHAAAQSPAPSGAPDTDGWKTIIYPIHAWLPVFGAEARLPGSDDGSGGITIPSAKTSGSLNSAALFGFRVERARVSIGGDFLWAGMSGSVDLPHFDLTLDTISFRVTGGFEVAPALYVDGGVRRFVVDMHAAILAFPPVAWKPGIWEPVVGATFRPQLSKNVRIFTRADFGWSGDDSNRSGSANAGIEWKPISHLSLGGGWGWLYLRADGTILTKDVHFAQTLNGPILTLGIPF